MQIRKSFRSNNAFEPKHGTHYEYTQPKHYSHHKKRIYAH